MRFRSISKPLRLNARRLASGMDARFGGSPRVRRGTRMALKTLGAGLAYGAFIEPHWIEITTISIVVPDLPPALDGYRIAHLTDLHYNIAAGKNFLRRVVAKTNLLDVDMVALTGDFIGYNPRNLYRCMALLSDIQAPDGCWVVRGNHDYHATLDDMKSACRDVGFRLLENQHALVRPSRHRVRQGQSFELDNRGSMVIAGVGDLWLGDCRPGKALEGADSTLPTVLLSHNPHGADLLVEDHHVDLVLSGHTHGGQIRPLGRALGCFSDGSSKYVSGLVRTGDTSVYISRGVGTSAFRFRWNCRPEIALIELHAGPKRRGGQTHRRP